MNISMGGIYNMKIHNRVVFQSFLDLIDEEDWKRWEQQKQQQCTIEYYLVFLEPRRFSSMFPSISKGEIVIMNTNGIPLGEYPKHY